MESDKKAYSVTINVGQRYAYLILITYALDPSRKHVVLEFHELGNNFGDSGLNIPSSRLPTFKEELRVLGKAVTLYQGLRSGEEKIIEEKLKEAYGSEATVIIREIVAGAVGPGKT